MKAVIVIPARLESTRLPRKLLLNETGKPLIQHTWEQAMETGLPVYVATDSWEISEACKEFRAQVIMTSSKPRNGTERVAIIAQRLKYDLYVNLQADEVGTSPNLILDAVELFNGTRPEQDKVVDDIVTMASPISDEERFNDPSCVKVVWNVWNRPLYFSRSPIPFPGKRKGKYGPLASLGYEHVGVYVYRRDALLNYPNKSMGWLERRENLEQMRFVEHEFRMCVWPTIESHFSINTRDDYDAFVERQKVMV